jgi:hypothetical protein
MRRTLPFVLTLAIGVVAPSAASAAAQVAPSLRATLLGCHVGTQPGDRVAAFVGSMPSQAATDHMAMRFDLQARRPADSDWTDVPGAPGFGSWERSATMRAGFVFVKRIDGLGPGLLYRAVIRFRWYAADGTIQRREQRTTRACRQPGAVTGDTLG